MLETSYATYLNTCPNSWAIIYDVDNPLSFTIAQLDVGEHIELTSATPKVLHGSAVEFLHIESLKEKLHRKFYSSYSFILIVCEQFKF